LQNIIMVKKWVVHMWIMGQLNGQF